MTLGDARETTNLPSKPNRNGGLTSFIRPISMALGPIIAALITSGLILIAFGINPVTYYSFVIERGLISGLGLEQTLTRMAPLLLLAAGLIVAFKAGLWNLGVDGQFLLGAVASAALAPSLLNIFPGWLVLTFGFLIAALFIETLSAPAFKKSVIPDIFLIPPPTVRGTKHFSAVFFITSIMGFRS